MLYTYQLDGVAWLYRLHTLQRGGILAGGHWACRTARMQTNERKAAVGFVATTLCMVIWHLDRTNFDRR